MTRALLKVIALAALVVGGAFALARYVMRSPEQVQLEAARAQIDDLQHAVARLTATRRVAQALVTDQHAGPDGVVRTTLLLEEYAAGDDAATANPIPPLRVEIAGTEAHLDASVITFEDGLVAAGDPFRGRSVALFTRLYGDHQMPAAGTPVDTPDRIGLLDRGTDPRVTAYQRSLWSKFWNLAESPALRKAEHVTSAGGAGVHFQAKPGFVYTVTLHATSAMTVTADPLPGLYRDALKVDAKP